ncbi:hypothetical protein D3C87_1814640 [compost metagenome]
MRSQFSSSDSTPARPGAACWSALSQRNASFIEPPRPGSIGVRGMPIRLRLYFAAGMPALAQFSMMAQTASICRSRSGPASRISG